MDQSKQVFKTQDESAESQSAAASAKSGASGPLPFKVDKYANVEPTWPTSGRHILATFDENSIIVYQAYNTEIATHAVTHQTFSGCAQFRETRMTWIKTNFLWMMYRSNWGRKDPNQSRILAITITRHGFEDILSNASGKEKDADVRLQWDPDHTPYGDKADLRRAIQLGLRSKILQKFLHEWTVRIDDVTEFVEKQREFVDAKRLDLLYVPAERVYNITDSEDLAKRVGLD